MHYRPTFGMRSQTALNALRASRRKLRMHVNDNDACATSMSTAIQNTRFGLDSRMALRAYRLIGGFDGIQLHELREAVMKVRDENLRNSLLNHLDALFQQFDPENRGTLDISQFELLAMSSTLVEQAVRDLLDKAHEEAGEQMDVENASNGHDLVRLDLFAVITSLVYVVVVAIQTDISPDWVGWDVLEILFFAIFAGELFVRFTQCNKNKRQLCMKEICHQLNELAAIIDIMLLLLGFVEICMSIAANRTDYGVVNTLRWVRLLRLGRCARLVRVLWYCEPLRMLSAGILKSLQSALWGVALISCIILVWAILIRRSVVNDWTRDATLSNIFPSIPETMMVLYRCAALSADGACSSQHQHGSIYAVLANEFGFGFEVAWAGSETIILLGILNAVAGIFLVQATENAQMIHDEIDHAYHREYQDRLEKLDKTLRTLIHPGREMCNPKDRNAGEVAKLIRDEYPEVVAHIPNLEAELVHFAGHILEAKKCHQSAMDTCEANELHECKVLRQIPSAKTYIVNKVQAMYVDDSANISNHLNLSCAPLGAIEVTLVQDHDNLQDLLRQAIDVQQFVKSMLLPGSLWSKRFAAGSSGEIWKESKGLCDEAIDPGVKSEARSEQKVTSKYNGRYERNRDYCRLALVFNSVSHLIQAIPRFLQFRDSTDNMSIVSLENRFVNPHPLGWRDVTMLLRVRVPNSDDKRHHVMELQLRLRELMEISHVAHKFYEHIRANLPDAVVTTILDRLVTDSTLDLGITKSEWLQCLPNKQVRKLLNELGIPPRARHDLFDMLDIDDSGTVSSSELQEMLSLFHAPAQAHELVGCHHRVRDIQQMILTKLKPQMLRTHNLTTKLLSGTENVVNDLFQQLRNLITEIHGMRSRSFLDASPSSSMLMPANVIEI